MHQGAKGKETALRKFLVAFCNPLNLASFWVMRVVLPGAS